jgi:hypothetical protein
MRKGILGAAHVIVVAAALVWTATAAAASAVIGSVLAVRGAVSVDSGNGAQPLAPNAPVRVSDTIVSGAGKAKIALNDGAIISIGENSKVRLADYEISAGNVNANVNVIAGALRLIVDKVSPGGRFEVQTETAIAAVRGTDWVVDVTPDQTAVAVVSGVVAVSSRGDTQGTVVVEGRGQGTDVRRGRAPTGPAMWSAARFANTLGRATFE